jgi:hypothetical protein
MGAYGVWRSDNGLAPTEAPPAAALAVPVMTTPAPAQPAQSPQPDRPPPRRRRHARL